MEIQTQQQQQPTSIAFQPFSPRLTEASKYFTLFISFVI